MISGSSIPREVGKRYTGLWDAEGVYRPEQPFLVLRVATMEEYIQFITEAGFDISHFGPAHWAKIRKGYFYEISID